MANDTYMIHNADTGEINIETLTDEEQSELDSEREAALADKAKRVLEAKNLRLLKISAYEKLGLSEAEIEALLPSN